MSKTTSTVKQSAAVTVGVVIGVAIGCALINAAFRVPKALRKYVPSYDVV